jgi:hypothetical protein
LSPGSRRGWILAAVLLAFALHNDFWLWHDARLVWGLPIGLAYHVAYCLGVSLLMGLLVTRARR